MTVAADTAAPRLALPHSFGESYLLFDRIGVGGMAEIYLARNTTRLGATRLAVVKLVLPAFTGDAHFAAMLTAEAKLAAQLSHANVVQTFDLGREQGRLYIAMEYVEGFDLNDLLRRCSRAKVPLPAEFALFVVGEALRGLAYAHRAKDPEGKPLGIVHRDVSPSNVLVSFEGEVKLCDFGIARAMNAGDADLSAEAIEGKAAYMSPEQARGDALDGRADVFAASIILWELLAGRRLYRSTPGGKDLLTQAREGDVPPLPDRGLPHHARIAAIVAKGLAPRAEDRYATALAMARELDDYVMQSGLRASPLKLGSFLFDTFGAEIVETRRARERAAASIEEADEAGETLADGTDPMFAPPAPEAVTPSEPSHSIVRLAPSKPEGQAEAAVENDTEKSPPPAGQLVIEPRRSEGAAEKAPAAERAPVAEKAPVVATPAPAKGPAARPVVIAAVVIALFGVLLGYLLGHR